MKGDPYNQYVELGTHWLLTNIAGIITAILVLLIGRLLAKWCGIISKKALIQSGMDLTLARFLSNLIYYALLTAIILAAADQLGIKTTSFLAIMGAAGLAIGLALKDSLANFAAGIILILFQPFKVGDAVSAANITGKVEQIDIFSTVILTFDNKKIIIPNSSITKTVITNISAMPTRRIDLIIGIGYDDDISAAKKLLEQILQTENKILPEPSPNIAVNELAASSINIRVQPWVKTEDYGSVKSQLLEKIKLNFTENKISLPYPQQDIHLYQSSKE